MGAVHQGLMWLHAALAMLPGLTMGIWPWEWFEPVQEAADSAKETAAMVIQFLVGMMIATIGFLMLIGKIPAPFGLLGRLLIGGGVVVAGAMIALGMIWSVG